MPAREHGQASITLCSVVRLILGNLTVENNQGNARRISLQQIPVLIKLSCPKPALFPKRPGKLLSFSPCLFGAQLIAFVFFKRGIA